MHATPHAPLTTNMCLTLARSGDDHSRCKLRLQSGYLSVSYVLVWYGYTIYSHPKHYEHNFTYVAYLFVYVNRFGHCHLCTQINLLKCKSKCGNTLRRFTDERTMGIIPLSNYPFKIQVYLRDCYCCCYCFVFFWIIYIWKNILDVDHFICSN